MSRAKRDVRRRFRAAVMGRDGYRCRHCGRAGYDRQGPPAAGLVPLDAHHVRPRAECPDGGYSEDNGLTLCGECHEREEFGSQPGGVPCGS